MRFIFSFSYSYMPFLISLLTALWISKSCVLSYILIFFPFHIFSHFFLKSSFWYLPIGIFEYKYIWRDRNTSFSKICGRYDRARCLDNFNHEKVIIHGYSIEICRNETGTTRIWICSKYPENNVMIFARKFWRFL